MATPKKAGKVANDESDARNKIAVEVKPKVDRSQEQVIDAAIPTGRSVTEYLQSVGCGKVDDGFIIWLRQENEFTRWMFMERTTKAPNGIVLASGYHRTESVTCDTCSIVMENGEGFEYQTGGEIETQAGGGVVLKGKLTEHQMMSRLGSHGFLKEPFYSHFQKGGGMR